MSMPSLSMPLHSLVSNHSSISKNEMNSSGFDQMKSHGQQYEAKKLCSPFLNKLEEMLSSPDNNNFIFWNDDGSSFTIRNPTEFSESVLPKYYKHNKIASFIRQLNMYGFHKKTRALRRAKNNHYQSWEFYHPKFLKDQFNLRKDIQRFSSEKDEFSSLTPDNDISQQLSEYQIQQNNILSQLESLETNLTKVKSELSETNQIIVFQKNVIQNLSASLLSQASPQTVNSFVLPSCNMSTNVSDTPGDCSQPVIFITPPHDVPQNSSKQALQNYNNNDYYGIMNHPKNHIMKNPQPQTFNENQMCLNRPQMPNSVNERPALSINTMSLQPQPQIYINSNSVLNQQCSEASYYDYDNDYYILSPVSPVSPMLFQSINYLDSLNRTANSK